MKVFLCIVIITVVAYSKVEADGKCSPSDELKSIVKECAKSHMNPDRKQMKKDVGRCAFKKLEVLNDETFDEEKAKTLLSSLEASDEIKQSLMDAVDTCKSSSSDGNEIADCATDELLKVCM